ncbi:Rubisco methyltransferase family protein [Zea mays]|uniref:Rubisco methyltransferase family protein n=1 Tax=Zea mays TaxID=4577 RepID=A0A1D6L5N4_MAIZE|nr:Rubisco methyltransferase family protein [Zea mays]
MAYAFLVVSPPDMSQCFEEMAAAASNKTSSKPGLNYPGLEEQALQFILDCCESNIEKYTKYLESEPIMFQGGAGSLEVSMNAKQANRTLLLKQLARDLCISERRILYRTQYVSQ